MLAQGTDSLALQTAAQVPLTRWTLHNTSPQMPSTAYNRRLQFGTWINDPTDNTCFNTRAKILIRDSKVPVSYKATNKCVVEAGAWVDPYTSKTFTSARDIQIDHVVPLKHAYQTGAWKWNYQARCLYANFAADGYHLLAVNGHENMKKGDKSPDDYMPPNPKIACGYLQIWLKIKLAWGLVIFPNEADGIKNLFTQYRCNAQQFKMDQAELARQRKAMSELLMMCKKPAAGTLRAVATTSGPEVENPFLEAVTQ